MCMFENIEFIAKFIILAFIHADKWVSCSYACNDVQCGMLAPKIFSNFSTVIYDILELQLGGQYVHVVCINKVLLFHFLISIGTVIQLLEIGWRSMLINQD